MYCGYAQHKDSTDRRSIKQVIILLVVVLDHGRSTLLLYIYTPPLAQVDPLATLLSWSLPFETSAATAWILTAGSGDVRGWSWETSCRFPKFSFLGVIWRSLTIRIVSRYPPLFLSIKC